MTIAHRYRLLGILLLIGGISGPAFAAEPQSVEALRESYSGKARWDPAAKTLTFTSSGTINFDKPDYKNHFWDVPAAFSTIVIDPNVTVTGAFHTYHDCTIRGVDRKSSIVFGTNEPAWANNRNIDAWKYCQFQNFGGVLTVRNLTALNPFSYFIRGWKNVCHAKSCTFLDNRGGWGNHSDGFCGGHGSTVEDCWLECGDDVIKCYFDITVTDCTIRMIQNSVPFQFGWNTYQDSTAHLSNIRIIGDWGRGRMRPIFQWKAGADHKTVTMDNCTIENPNASLFVLLSEGTLDLTITNARIAVKNYGTKTFKGTRTICGTTEPSNTYNCKNH